MNFFDLVTLQLMMFILMLVGAFLRRKEIIKESDKILLTNLLINVILPCNIIASFSKELSIEVVQGGIIILVISILIEVFSIGLSYLIYNKVPSEKKKVLQYGTICSNAGFIGNPVVEGVYGLEGVLYASIYLIPQRIVMWSFGIAFFTESPDIKSLIKKVLLHPCIIAVEIGCIIMVTGITIPSVLGKSIMSLSDCTTGISMILIGAILAEANILTRISKTLLSFTFVRLILIPAVVLGVCLMFDIPQMIVGISVLLAAMPAGSTTAILASKYNGDTKFATQCVVFTTILSMVFVPIWCLIINGVY